MKDFERPGASSKAPARRKAGALLVKSRFEPPPGFLVISHEGGLKAISPDDAKFRGRVVVDPWGGTLDFWTKALKNHFLENHGYVLLDERPHRSKGQNSLELMFEATVRGKKHRYLLKLSMEPATWTGKKTLHLTELTAPADIFDQYLPALK